MSRRSQFSLRRLLAAVSILAVSVSIFRGAFGFHFGEAMLLFVAAIGSAGWAFGILINRPIAGLLLGVCAAIAWDLFLCLSGNTP